MSTKETTAALSIVDAVLAIVKKQGGIKLTSLKTELKAANAEHVLKTDDIVAFGEDGFPIGLTTDYMEGLTFIAYHRPLAEGTSPEDVKKAIRIFLAPQDTEFLSDGEDDGDDSDLEGEGEALGGGHDFSESIGLPTGAIEKFLVESGDELTPADTAAEAIGLVFKFAADKKQSRILGAVALDVDYTLTLGEKATVALQEQQATAAAEATEEEGAGDADEDDDN